ncbi:MAG TPA: multicopper oxidase domain-containing protein [Thermoanaerobaculia bacterium]|nr:multicopper oxidase domain-containing protein [Thermoanaerobaculia bacterium]
MQVRNTVDPGNLSPFPINLLTVKIAGTAKSPAMDFIATAPKPPDFLDDIPAEDVKATKTIDFSTVPQVFKDGVGPPRNPAAIHKIDGKQFDGDVGALVRLNTVEEWTVRNFATSISHPFHIHINPFQVIEEFRPKDTLADGKTPKYVTDPAKKGPSQCLLDPKDPATWKPCDGPPPTSKDKIWWDVFPIPSGLKTTVKDDAGNPIVIPGYFKMRSRFVDYAGFYVIHCHILAHEDRGMMTVVEVAPSQSPYSHH